MIIEIKKGMSISEIIDIIKDIPINAIFKHHVFKTRDIIELVFEIKERN